ncbi:conserved hypothetical protein [Coccidioides posadasii str. Silveira]|uniref:Major facilitator superfamily (MFS) profile domain-containing protein n=2 Tax=Coccidioides posadasii TaxID=199306 RepID=E9CWF5_COCPS|nr:conserved hypothetical protein [Coccidioides posadasii str. Silveira]KMM65105.1 transporter protein [Coccidioides posadasii RMSCC 3488]
MMAVSNIIGPPLGGIITNRLGWRWCFWVNLPCGGAAFVVGLIFLKEMAPPSAGLSITNRLVELDLLGAVLLLGGITSFVLAREWAGNVYPWSDARVWGCIVAASLVLAIFCVLQWHLGDKATLPPRLLFKQRTIFSASLFSCFLAMGFYIHVFYLPSYFQAVKGSSPEKSGLDGVPYQASNTATSLIVGLLVGLVG